MQPTLPPLPKFDLVWNDSQTTPERWDWDLFLTLEFACHFFDLIFQFEPTVVVVVVVVVVAVVLGLCFGSILHLLRMEYAGLSTGPSSYPAPPRPRVEINLALLAGETFTDALDSDLPFQRFPPETQAGVGVGGDVGRLSTRPKVGIHDEPSTVEFLQVDDSGTHSTGR